MPLRGTGDRGIGVGDEPFGSVLVAADGTLLAQDHNRVASGDRTRHPEFELARWAAANITLRNELQPPSSPQVSTAQCAPPQTAGWGGPRRICEFFRTTGNLARRARSSHPSRAQLSNPGDRPRSFGGGTCSGPRRAGARLAPPLLQLNPPISGNGPDFRRGAKVSQPSTLRNQLADECHRR